MRRYTCDRCDADISCPGHTEKLDVPIEWPDTDRVGSVRIETMTVAFTVYRPSADDETPDLCGDCHAHILHELASRLDTDSTPDHIGAAAPDLLAAMKAVLPFIDDANDVQQVFPDSACSATCRAAVVAAKAAIAKAEGRS